jgi:hypothetical protein
LWRRPGRVSSASPRGKKASQAAGHTDGSAGDACDFEELPAAYDPCLFVLLLEF